MESSQNTNSKPRYRAVIFDLDDTLLKTHEAKFAHHKAAGKKFYNIELTDDDIKPHWGKPLHELIQILYRGADTVENMLASFLTLRDHFPKSLQDGAVEVVKELLAAGVEVGVVTASPANFAIIDLQHYGFPVEHMLLVQGSEHTSVHKPDPRVFSPLLERLAEDNISKDHIVYVGDAPMDYLAARDAGLDFIGVATGLVSRDELISHGAKVVVDGIPDVLKIVLSAK